MQNPKECKTFELYGKCKINDCAYLHIIDIVNHKVDTLDKEVKDLKEEFLKLTENKNSRNNVKFKILKKKGYIPNQLHNKPRKSELLLEDLNNKNKILTEIKTSYQSPIVVLLWDMLLQVGEKSNSKKPQ